MSLPSGSSHSIFLVFHVSSSVECIIEERTTYQGNNIDISGKGKYRGTKVASQQACAQLSFLTEGAKFWSYVPAKNLCWVKTSKSGRKSHKYWISGNSECGKIGKQ